MALQEDQTLLKIARNIREMATVIDKRSEAIQSNLFGSEPRDVAGNPPSVAVETVEGVLREALAILNSADSQFARTYSHIGDDRGEKGEVGYASAKQAAYAR